MKGLLIKDLQYMKKQKHFWAIVVLMCTFFVLSDTSPMFVIGYCTLLTAFFMISTVSWDKRSDSEAYLFTMPVSRTGYVKEKYLLIFVSTCIAWAVIAGIMTAVMDVRHRLDGGGMFFLQTVLILVTALAAAAAAIPIELKFGAEKSRVVIMTGAGLIVLAGYGISTFVKSGTFDPEMVIFAAMRAGKAGICTAAAVLLVLVTVISYYISKRIQANKEF